MANGPSERGSRDENTTASAADADETSRRVLKVRELLRQARTRFDARGNGTDENESDRSPDDDDEK